MALLLFKLDKLFTLLVPELVLLVEVVVTFARFRRELFFDQVKVCHWRDLSADC
jgi:hypothetical protein